MARSSAAYTKPLPDVKNPVAKPFWAAAKRRQLMMQQCPSCGYVRYPSAPLCPECLGENDRWAKLSGKGKVWTYCVYRHLFHESFKKDLPYNVTMVQLEEGPMLVTNLVGIANEKIKVNMPVEAVFEDVTSEVTLVKFKPAGQRPGGRRRPPARKVT